MYSPCQIHLFSHAKDVCPHCAKVLALIATEVKEEAEIWRKKGGGRVPTGERPTHSSPYRKARC